MAPMGRTSIVRSLRQQLLRRGMTIEEVVQRESGERGINSHKNPPVLPPAAPRKKRARASKPAQPEEGVLLTFDQELPQIANPVAAFGLEWLEKRATDLEQTRGKVSGQ